MFERLIIKDLQMWVKKPNRKPMVLRGVRQVGKTTLVRQFSRQFKQYIHLNLELPDDRLPFEQFRNIDTLIQSVFFMKNCLLEHKKDTLLFIDEIQEVPQALGILRYFFELEPDLPVIAAGSMLESLFNKNISFPVGRVEYRVLRPVSFPEFLDAMGESAALAQLNQVPIAQFAHNKLLQLFHTYALIGGMPEIVQNYSQNHDLVALSPIYDSLLTSYFDDVEKYATSDTQIAHIRHAITASLSEAGKRIKFEGFGNSSYRSRDMGEALRTIEKALLVYLNYPVTSVKLPFLPDKKRSPRLHFVDTGLINYAAGIQKDIIGTSDLHSIHQGTIIEHLIGQELISFQNLALSSLHFWVREKKTSNAEIDYVYPYNGRLIPIEVKSGKEGTMRSLHQFMNESDQSFAIRFYSGELNLTNIETAEGKRFQLLSLPYYLSTQIDKYLQWFQKDKGQLLNG